MTFPHVRFRLWFAALALLSAALAASVESSGLRPDPEDHRAADRATVARVIDGDTIELTDGRMVRYIGIDTPEVRRRADGRWVEDPEPFGKEATQANAALVRGRVVRLEYDVQRRDRYGRLLAYVYISGPDQREVMVNEELLRVGAAQLLTIPPNVRHVERFRRAVRDARRVGRGVWAEGN
ncbi:MAG: thermonuclease family protein [Candidatus Omnitrophica bacterium]|nr:thermonuclease family protein [Candidatus Omnitrophota bacterium]